MLLKDYISSGNKLELQLKGFHWVLTWVKIILINMNIKSQVRPVIWIKYFPSVWFGQTHMGYLKYQRIQYVFQKLTFRLKLQLGCFWKMHDNRWKGYIYNIYIRHIFVFNDLWKTGEYCMDSILFLQYIISLYIAIKVIYWESHKK